MQELLNLILYFLNEQRKIYTAHITEQVVLLFNI